MICFWTARPFSIRVSGVVVDWPGRGNATPSFGENLVGGVDEVEHLGHADIGHGLVDDLLDLDRRDADGERRAEHHAILAQRLAGDHRRELDHQPGASVEIAVSEHFVEGEIVEGLDQFRVGHRQPLKRGRGKARRGFSARATLGAMDCLLVVAGGETPPPSRMRLTVRSASRSASG